MVFVELFKGSNPVMVDAGVAREDGDKCCTNVSPGCAALSGFVCGGGAIAGTTNIAKN